MSLASLYFEPLWVFSRRIPGPTDLRELRGRRLAVGPGGQRHPRRRADPARRERHHRATARVLPLTGLEAVQALRRGAVDTVFLIAGTTPRR